MKKIVVFGGNGFVGGNIAGTACKNGWKVYIASRSYTPGLENVEWKCVDITQREAVFEIIERIKPDAVVNSAAIADIDKAEQNKELAWKINVEGALNIAEACNEFGVKYIFFSSDAVFDGKSDSYSEDDLPNPINYYGRTKAEAEKAVLKAFSKAIVIRISLVIGFSSKGGSSLFRTLKAKLSSEEDFFCPIDEIRSPVDVLTLSECILELCESDFSGMLHIASTDIVSKYGLARITARIMGLDEVLVKEQINSNNTARAPRHKKGVLNIAKAQSMLRSKLISVEESIKRVVSER